MIFYSQISNRERSPEETVKKVFLLIIYLDDKTIAV